MPTKKTPAVEEDLERVVAKNKGVDIEQLREAQALLEELRKHGFTRPHYDLASPYERRPVRKRENPGPRLPSSR